MHVYSFTPPQADIAEVSRCCSKVRVENLPTPADYIPKVLEEVRPLYIKRTYEVSTWKDTEDFLTKLAIRSGKLLKVRVIYVHPACISFKLLTKSYEGRRARFGYGGEDGAL